MTVFQILCVYTNIVRFFVGLVTEDTERAVGVCRTHKSILIIESIGDRE